MTNPYFIKNNPIPGSRMIECERRGLELLRRYKKRHGLNTPQYFNDENTHLKLEKIEPTSPTPQDWEALALGLVKLHQITSNRFGFDYDGFIGLKPQLNTRNDNWGEFFFHNRLFFQVQLISNSELKADLMNQLQKKKPSLIEFLNSHSPNPSLLHGDLWSGNVMFDSRGPWLIDPAIYYGDRECDLAMTKMFGGFDVVFYETYFSLAPLPAGSDLRFTIYNLYHYLNHFNIFGESYLAAVRDGFEKLPS